MEKSHMNEKTAWQKNDDPIEHVVVLMLENRSFDHVIGCLSKELGLDGIPKDGEPRTNKDPENGHDYPQEAGAARVTKYDPRHEAEHVAQQLRNKNGGFVDDFVRSYPRSEESDRREVMRYHDVNTLPALQMLARNFTVCDRWFSSVPGPTWTNRIFVHSGTSLGRVSMPEGILDANLHWYDQTTIYDRLNEKGIPWRIYYGDIAQSLVLVHQLEPKNAVNYFKLRTFFEDAAGDSKSFPCYGFIEPAYYPPGANDAHPPHDILGADQLVADVYCALRSNASLWQSTLLVVLFDEHGGLYDHVEPPQAVPPDFHSEEYDFKRLGVRVPSIVISPYALKKVDSTVFDHTSLLKYLIEKWGLGPLGNRTANAQSIAICLSNTPRLDTPAGILESNSVASLPPDPWAGLVGRVQLKPSAQHAALFAWTQLLESAVDVGLHDFVSRAKRIITGFDGMTDVAIERVEQFLEKQREIHGQKAKSG
jgi:phospholipase C